MAQAWLNPTDYQALIPDIPGSFRFEKLDALEREVVLTWLADLLTRDQLSTYRTWLDDDAYAGAFEGDYDEAIWLVQYPNVTDVPFRAGRAMRQFLVYAVWSQFVLQSGVHLTDTGHVVKLNPDSEPISNSLRTQLSVRYRTLAERKAAEMLSALAEQPSVRCGPTTFPGIATVHKAQRRNPSRFGN